MRSFRGIFFSAPVLVALAGCSTEATPGDSSAPTGGVTIPEQPDGPFRDTPSAPTLRARTAPRAPPVIAGGTLLALRDGRTLAASDPDHGAVWIVDGAASTPPFRVSLRPGDEPGRLVEDGAGRVHVVLRGAGEVATVDAQRREVVARRAVCPAPRGLAWNAPLQRLHVVCAGGEFVTIAGDGSAATVDALGGDLRDVAVHDGAVYVSRFRSASVERVELTNGRAVRTQAVLSPAAGTSTAWRMAAAPGGLVVLSQAVRSLMLGSFPSGAGYYGDVTSRTIPVMPRVRVVGSTGAPALDTLVADGGLTVDVATFADGDGWRVALVSPGWAFRQGRPQVREWRMASVAGQRTVSTEAYARAVSVVGQAVAAAYTSVGELVVQTRAPGRIHIGQRAIVLYDDNVADTGHDLFHATTRSGLACASCHPEGGEDGLTWIFADVGRRRTPLLRGGILQTAPFHWGGDLRDMTDLTAQVYTSRMGGGTLEAREGEALGRWLDTLRAVPYTVGDRAAVARGEALFRSESVGCATCHDGAAYTNNQTVAVGTGGAFQVPPLLGLAGRAPYMHDGCAATLRQRFTDARCGGGDLHGRTSQLSEAQVDDLVAWLASL